MTTGKFTIEERNFISYAISERIRFLKECAKDFSDGETNQLALETSEMLQSSVLDKITK